MLILPKPDVFPKVGLQYEWKMQRNPEKVDVLRWLFTLLVYAMGATTMGVSHGFPTHFDPLVEVKDDQKPLQSTQYM